MARIDSTATPLRSMIAIERSASAWVLDASGERLSVALMYTALRSEKSERDCSHSSSCIGVSRSIAAPPFRAWVGSPTLAMDLLGHGLRRPRGLEVQGGRVDTEALAGRAGSVVEDVTEM